MVRILIVESHTGMRAIGIFYFRSKCLTICLISVLFQSSQAPTSPNMSLSRLAVTLKSTGAPLQRLLQGGNQLTRLTAQRSWAVRSMSRLTTATGVNSQQTFATKAAAAEKEGKLVWIKVRLLNLDWISTESLDLCIFVLSCVVSLLETFKNNATFWSINQSCWTL